MNQSTQNLNLKRIILVEDEDNLRNNYSQFLKKQGYDVLDFADRHSALKSAKKRLPDLAILDIMLGSEHEGGFLLCQELRILSKSLPIIFLTALDTEYDRISGFRFGGWDYLTKDISLPLLGVRITNILRITEDLIHSKQADYEYTENLIVDSEHWRVLWKNEQVNLTLTEFQIVFLLSSHTDQIQSFDSLMESTRQKIVNENTVSTHIRRIRRKFQEIDESFNCIQSVHGIGYRWVNEI